MLRHESPTLGVESERLLRFGLKKNYSRTDSPPSVDDLQRSIAMKTRNTVNFDHSGMFCTNCRYASLDCVVFNTVRKTSDM